MKPCTDDQIRNPKTKRCVQMDGKVFKELLQQWKSKQIVFSDEDLMKLRQRGLISPKKPTSDPAEPVAALRSGPGGPSTENSSSTSSSSSLSDTMKELQNKMTIARQNRNIPEIIALTKEIEAQRTKRIARKSAAIPVHLQVCIDPTTKTLPKLPTLQGDVDMIKAIPHEKDLIIIDGLCYNIKELIELIKVDIRNGNVWGMNPYVKREGLLMPFEKGVKEHVLQVAKERGIVPKTMQWENRNPENADDKELQGSYTMTTKPTPSQWLRKGWASDGSAFPTKEYYAISFDFPYKRVQQTPGRTAIFPKTKEAKEFIMKKLLPVYKAGALWSKKRSVTLQTLVLNPSIHLIFEDNQPNRWYAKKLENLEEEILKFAPAFS